MSNKVVPDIFVDMITNVTYANGVLRVALARAGANNEPEPVAMMFLPGTQIQVRQEETQKSSGSGGANNVHSEGKGSPN